MAAVSDPIADMLTRVRNGLKMGAPEVRMPASKLKQAVAETIRVAGYITEVRLEGEGPRRSLILVLKYHGRQPAIEGLKRISKPSCRMYVGSDKIPRVLGGFGIAVLSTSQGVMTDRQARAAKLGGELLCYVW